MIGASRAKAVVASAPTNGKTAAQIAKSKARKLKGKRKGGRCACCSLSELRKNIPTFPELGKISSAAIATNEIILFTDFNCHDANVIYIPCSVSNEILQVLFCVQGKLDIGPGGRCADIILAWRLAARSTWERFRASYFGNVHSPRYRPVGCSTDDSKGFRRE